MNRLLIVDDEKMIVDGIYELFEQSAIADLDIYRAYSGKMALKLLGRTKCDVVLSDIAMPGMDGLQLQRDIHRLWPHCKVIFLTSHNDFHYAHNALRSGIFDYVLKTEEDDHIIDAVRRALDTLEAERRSEAFIDQARKQLHEALPALSKEHLRKICNGIFAPADIAPSTFAELHIPLDASKPVWPIIGRVDDWNGYESAADRALLTYALQNMSGEYFVSGRFYMIALDSTHFAMFVQAREREEMPEDAERHSGEQQLRLFIVETVEMIRSSVKQLCKLPVSFAVGQGPVMWDRLYQAFERLRKLLVRGLGSSGEMIVCEGTPFTDVPAAASDSHRQTVQTIIRRLGDIELTDRRQHDRFAEVIQELQACLASGFTTSLYLEVYYSLAAHLLSEMSRWAPHLLQADTGIESILEFRAEKSYAIALDDLIKLSARLLDESIADQRERTHQVIRKLHQYIADNLDRDLSLTALSDVVYLNPVYLSRLYKQSTGIGLVDYINDIRMQRAKSHLAETQLKIHEIARSIGIETPTYFARLFKRREGITPQEYRDRFNK
ncbi:response regulator [Paenibacillus sp. MBLB4367]|uniref:response regulator n=1 Tax=Paenibacillus sp. MBLB4367 TaxID=3384767 RepID=UPI003907EB57